MACRFGKVFCAQDDASSSCFCWHEKLFCPTSTVFLFTWNNFSCNINTFLLTPDYFLCNVKPFVSTQNYFSCSKSCVLPPFWNSKKKRSKTYSKAVARKYSVKKKVSQKFCKTDRKKPVSEFLQKALLKKR